MYVWHHLMMSLHGELNKEMVGKILQIYLHVPLDPISAAAHTLFTKEVIYVT